ncbi:MAG TPA: metallophosphoesterase [Nanoarchaeota archaeon]|nr:metallophosphoesterase [Nanoarchaeota archaeon]
MAFEIFKGIFAIDLALYFDKTLVISDVHMGYEEAVNKQGVLVPRMQYRDTIARLEKLFRMLETEKLEVEKIIINGDLKHEFGTISETEWRNTLGVLDFLLEKCGNIILVRGNHDTILGPIANKRDIAVKDYELVNDILVCHGDKIPKKEALAKAKTIMIGHEHPAVSLREGSRAEKFKCFLKGKWNGKGIIVMPSFNMAVEGSDVLKEELLSPFLSDISGFEVLVAGGNGETLDFGTVKKLQAL